MDGAEHATVTKASASEAWAYVQELAASHELVKIQDPSGREIDWVELRALANDEVGPLKS